jgi:hypothetical protein
LHQGIGSWFAYILPSALVIWLSLLTTFALLIILSLVRHVACMCDPLFKFLTGSNLFARVLMLRREASPTETKLHDQYSNMINEALEMMESHPERTTDGFLPFSSTDSQTQL